MKITNISGGNVTIPDLNNLYLGPGGYVYLKNTSDVLTSTTTGNTSTLRALNQVSLEDIVVLGPSASTTLTHGFLLAPSIYILKSVGATWVDALGTVDITHDALFSSVTITNTTLFTLTYFIRLI